MNIKQIRELVEIMNNNDLSEVEIEQDGIKIKLAKKVYGGIEQVVTPVVQARQHPAAVSEEPLPQKENGKEIKAPMVGTFYRSPSPDVAPYVEEGDVIQKGDVLCIVEAMKVMNEVKAELGGRIARICVENAEPVEFGQVMFVVESI
ncbi:MAG: acetyl-CoA carboxylase biotin carboxyl carrier protein [Candidatus Omnitrophota bacterium]